MDPRFTSPTKPVSVLYKVQAINAEHVPEEFHEECEELDISLHGETKMYSISDDGGPFSEWLKKQGFIFEKGTWGWLGVWGT